MVSIRNTKLGRKKMDKIVYVILHYYTIEDTRKCVESIIEKEKDNNYEIVVVDNNSPNGTGEELKNKYISYDKIHVLINKENLGFSAGNNIGFKYAKYNLKADYIILLNNDTYLLQDNFSKYIIENFKEYNYAVLGPKIHTRDKICGPLWEKPFTRDSLKKEIYKLRIKLLAQYFNISLRKFWKKNIEEPKEYSAIQENVIIHGCFLIFSPVYVNMFDGLLEKTFFYGEEIVLYNRLKKHNMKILFDPKLEVFHNEFSSTNIGTKNNRQREIKRMSRLIEAFKIIVREWDN